MSKKTFVPAFTPRSLKYSIDKKSSHLWYLTVEIPGAMTAHIKDHITRLYRQYTLMPGISCNSLPITYTQHYFAQEIEKESRQFLYEHFIEGSIQSFLQDNKITTVNWPRIKDVGGSAQNGYTITIALSLAPQLQLHNWQTQTFVAPKRKNYTDLDIQVESFIATLEAESSSTRTATVELGDWVRFSAQFRSPLVQTPVHSHTQYWLRITNPILTSPAMQQFLTAKVGSSFTIPASALSIHQENPFSTDYYFDVTVEHIVKTQKLSVQQVQDCLHVSDHQMLHNKLIEIFSYRNDVSLRKAIIEELFYALFNAFRFEIAPHAITRRKELLLFLMHQTPDNSVYTKQKHFATHITLLAETKLKEEALIDAIAQLENITVTPEDITHYLSLASNERLKEFLYFSPLTEDAISSDQPCGEYILNQTVRREKTLNAIIQQIAI